MALFAILTLPMRVLGFLLESLPRAVVSVDRLDEVIATEAAPIPDPSVRDRPPRRPPRGRRSTTWASRTPTGPPVLDGLRFAVRPGEVVALTGATGSGKSTLCYLLAHLMDPTAGRVEVGGVDLTVVDPDELRASVALVFQETFLFADTVQENLTLSEPVADATVDWAVGVARADEFVGRARPRASTRSSASGASPSPAGSGSAWPSPGPCSATRACCILDDATSAVDPRIEQQILAGLRRELDMTTIVVAHRVSTIALADRVLYLDEGRLVADGSHAELLATVPGYEALIRAYEAADDGGAGMSLGELPHETAERLDPEQEEERARALEGLDADELPRTEIDDLGAIGVLRRGLAVSPELQGGHRLHRPDGAGDRGRQARRARSSSSRRSTAACSTRAASTGGSCSAPARVTFVIVVAVYVASRATYRRLVRATENTLYGLRVRVFAHIHALSIADHEATRRGVLVSRVTSDVETLARFAEWGAVSWMVNSAVIVGVVVVMFVYSWQLALITLAVFVPMLFILRCLQRRQLHAYDHVRTRVGDTLSEFSESIGGAAVIRAYGAQRRARRRLVRAIDAQYRAEVRGARFFAIMFPLGDVFGAVALSLVVARRGLERADAGASSAGELIAFLFLVNLLLTPIAELSEVLDQTQTALAGFRKVLSVLEVPVEVVEPTDGPELPEGPVAVRAEGVSLRVPHGTRGAPRGRRRHPGRDVGGGRGRDRLGQDHLRQAAVPPGRPDRGPHAARRHRRPRAHRREPAAVDPHGAPGRLPVRHHAGREPAGRPARRHRRRAGRRGRGARARPRGCDGLPGGPRHAGRRAGQRACRSASASWSP